MKSKFITDPQDALGSPDASDAGLYWSLVGFTPASSLQSASDPVILPTPPLVDEAVESSGAQSGPTTTLALTTGGITINLLFDAAAMAAPASFRAGIQQAASILTGAISDKITVNLKIDYSGTGGGAAAGPDNGQFESYSSVRTDLVNNATPGDTTFNALPGGFSFQGQSSVVVWDAQLKLWGLLGANDATTDDGSATFATDINSNLLVGVALHELTHAMGRIPYGPPYAAQPDIFDFFRFTAPGTRLINGAGTAPAAYFSVDGGNTKLADFGQTSDPSDFLNSGVQGPNDPFNEFYSGSTSQNLTTADKEILDALGFHLTAPNHPPVVTASNVQETKGAAAGALSTYLHYSDAEGDPAVQWHLQDVSSDMTSAVLINGVQLVPGGASITLTEAQFAAATIQPVLGSHDIWAVASDGTAWSTPVDFTVLPAINHPPVVTASNLQEVHGVAPGALSAHLQYSDADGDPAVQWHIQDVSSDTTSAVLFGGLALVPGAASLVVTEAQLAAATIQPVSGSHDIWAVASDGTNWSAPVDFTVSPAADPVSSTPVVTSSDLQEVKGVAAGALSAYLQYSDADGDPAVQWHIQDVSSDTTSAVSFGGVALVPGGASVAVTEAQFAAATIQPVSSSHQIWAVASDGFGWSSPVDFTVSPAANHAPALTASNEQEVSGVAPGALSARLQYSDVDGDSAFQWHLQDVSSDTTSAISIAGVAIVPGGPSVTVTEAQFASAMIQLVSGSHDIWAVASDGTSWSNPVHFTVSPPGSGVVQQQASLYQQTVENLPSPTHPDGWLLLH